MESKLLTTNFYKKSEEIGCTHFKFGEYELLQPKYECTTCLNESICIKCIKTCHAKCKHNFSEDSTTINAKFVCKCAKQQSHVARQLLEIQETTSTNCNLMTVDLKLDLKYSYLCLNHNVNICCLCYLSCHNGCNLSKEEKGANNVNSIKCDCKNEENHKFYNHFVFDLDVESFKKLTEIDLGSKLMIINYLSKVGVFKQMATVTNKFFDDGMLTQAVKQIIQIVAEKIKSKDYSPEIFSEEIVEIFPYQKLVNFLANAEISQQIDNKILMDLILIFYSFHLKKDFKNLKHLSVSDFARSFIMERIYFRRNVCSGLPIFYPQSIYDKYSQIFNLIKRIVFKFSNLFETTQDEFDSFITYLKLVKFCIKRSLFFREEYLKIIGSLYDFINQFLYLHEAQLEDSKNKVKIEKIRQIFCEIIFMISITYNDIVVEKKLKEGRLHSIMTDVEGNNNTFNYFTNFLNFKNEITSKLLQTFINLSILNLYNFNPQKVTIEKTQDNKKKFISNLMHENIRLFTVCDNIYYNQLKHLKKFASISIETSKIFSSNSNDAYKNVFTEFAAKLQQTENDLYFNPMNDRNIFFSLKNLFDNLTQSLNSNRVINNSNTDNSHSNNSCSKFIRTLLCELQNYFGFLTSVKSDNEIDSLISEIIKNNLDSSMLNFLIKISYFSTFSAEKTEEHILRENQCVEFIIKFLKIFCLSKKGLVYLTKGTTLQSLIKLIKIYKFKILNLLYTILKAAEKFNIDISNHFFLILIEKENSEFWLEFNEITLETENSQHDFEIFHSNILMMKIINKISYALPYEVYETIKSTIKKIILQEKTQGILNLENFRQIMNEALNNQKEVIIQNNKIKSNRHVLTPSVNSLVEHSVGEKLILKSLKPDQGAEELELINLKSQDINQRNIINNFTPDNPLLNQNLSEYNILIKFYFAFFELISKDTAFIKYSDCSSSEREEYYELMNFISEPIEIFFNVPISIRKRKILFRTIRTFYFIDHLDQYKYDSKKTPCFNYEFEILYHEEDEEFKNYIEKLPQYEKSQYSRDEYIKNGIKKKIKIYLRLQKHIDDFTEEIKNLAIFLEKFGSSEKFHDYVVEILLSIKFISEYLMIEEEFWNGVNFNLLKLGKMLVNNLKFFSEYFQNNYSIAELEAKINSFLLEFNPPSYKNLDKKEINKIIGEIFEIILPMEIKYKFFGKFLDKFEKIRSGNFLPDSLMDVKSFGFFTKKINTENQLRKSPKIIEKNIFHTIKQLYMNEFSDFDNSTFVQLIKIRNLNNKSDYLTGLMNLFNYFMSYENKNFTLNNLYTYLTLINKMLFFNTEAAQEKFFNQSLLRGDNENKLEEERNKLLWCNISGLIHDSFNNFFSLSKSYFSDSLKLNQMLLTNEIVHFYKLLSENRNSKFHIEFLEETNSFISYNNPSLFSVYFSYLIMMYRFIITEDDTKNAQIPYDIFICNIKNILDCLIEYIESLDENVFTLPFEEEDLIAKRKQKKLLMINKFELFMKEVYEFIPKMILTDISIYKHYTPSQNSSRSENKKNNIICFIKSQIFKFLNSFVSHSRKFDINYTLQYMNLECLYEEIFVNFKILLDHQILNKNLETNILDFSQNSLIENLDRLYIAEEKFRNSPQMEYCLAMVYYIKILTQYHKVQEFSEDLEERGVRLKYKNGKPIFDGAIPKTDSNYYSLMGFKIFNYLERIILKVDVFNGLGNEFIYFKRPILTFYLPEDTKLNFVNNVNRESVSTKLNSLYKETDYFIFEMNYHYHQKDTGNFVKAIKNFNYLFFEIFNYVLIVIHQILLIIEFFKSTSEDDVIYNNLEKNETKRFLLGNFILSIIQCVCLGVILILWMIFKFPLKFQRSIIKNFELRLISYDASDYSSNRVPFQTLRKIFEEDNIGNRQIISLFNQNLNFWHKFTAAFSSIVLNRDVNLMFLTFILTLTYLIFKQPLLLVFPAFFIANFFPTLYDIFIAIKLKYKQLITVLLFTYLTIYFFVWVSLLFLSEFFLYEDISDGKENYCSSSIQCIFFMIDYGTRSGGGIGDMINKISFKYDPSLFFVKFIFNLIFHILIILVMSNIFLGLIVDTFADLRDKTQLILFDKNKRCFICQLTSDDAVKRKIDFNLHVTQDHLLWNYVYFLTHMYISNKNNFNPLERGIWEKIRNNDLTWIPVENVSI